MNPDIKVEHLSDTCVRLTSLLEAPAERVYRAWTSPSEVGHWFAPAPGAKCEVSEMDVRIGGKYTMTVIMPEVRHTMSGRYTALEPGRLIRFSWSGTCDSEDEEASEVTVELTPVENGTQLTLTHNRLLDEDSCNRHAQGWIGCITGLSHYIGN